MIEDGFEMSESEHEVEDADEGRKRFRVTRIDVGPRDDQERAGLILARAQQWINRIRDKYMMLRSVEKAQAAAEGREVSGGEWLEHSLKVMIMCTDLAHDWMSCSRSQHEDLDGNLVMQRYELDGSISSSDNGIMLGDYVEILKRLYKFCKDEAEFTAKILLPMPSEAYFRDEVSRLPADLDHHQMEYERQGYHMDIGMRIDPASASYDQDDAIPPPGGGPIDPEPFKKRKPRKKRSRGGKRRPRR